MTDDESSMAIGKYLRQETRTLVKSRIDVEKFAIGAVERNHEFLDLKVPYILYQRFMTTSAFKKGMPYLEYVKAMEDRSISSEIPMKM